MSGIGVVVACVRRVSAMRCLEDAPAVHLKDHHAQDGWPLDTVLLLSFFVLGGLKSGHFAGQ